MAPLNAQHWSRPLYALRPTSPPLPTPGTSLRGRAEACGDCCPGSWGPLSAPSGGVPWQLRALSVPGSEITAIGSIFVKEDLTVTRRCIFPRRDVGDHNRSHPVPAPCRQEVNQRAGGVPREAGGVQGPRGGVLEKRGLQRGPTPCTLVAPPATAPTRSQGCRWCPSVVCPSPPCVSSLKPPSC